MPTKEISIQNPRWQELSWELRKLANILHYHKYDPHTENLSGQEVLPEACVFRRINDLICIASIKQSKTEKTSLLQLEQAQTPCCLQTDCLVLNYKELHGTKNPPQTK